jgi:prolyl-tRNA synthetase
VRARLDDRTNQSFGRRAVEWELKGVPVRLELGPRDLAEGVVTLVRRDREGKETVSLDAVAGTVPTLLDEIQRCLWEEAEERRDATTRDVGSPDEVDGAGFHRMPWDALGVAGEAALAERGFTVRCLVRAGGGIPSSRDEEGMIAYVARAY